MTGPRKTLLELHSQAYMEHPRHASAALARYRELLIEHGHLIDRNPGDDGNELPCGWKPKRVAR